ncbi:hypothetical protein F2981_17070 [Sinorhizobium meliloti]|nr:hypothetical protein [Sinorhizobium meliloti]
MLELLANPDDNVVVSATGVEPNDRPEFFAGLMPDLSALRAKTGRPALADYRRGPSPHAGSRDSASLALSDDRSGMIMITVHRGLGLARCSQGDHWRSQRSVPRRAT